MMGPESFQEIFRGIFDKNAKKKKSLQEGAQLSELSEKNVCLYFSPTWKI